MKIRRKVNQCLNCGALLNEVYNYCPICGQENNDNNVSLGTLINDFFSNYFAFDSKLVRTAVPFFLKPGFITNRYMEGKRVSYAHPVRMYLIISLFYFFIWSLIATDYIQDSEDSIVSNATGDIPVQVFESLDSAARKSVRENISNRSLERIDSAMLANDSLSFITAFRQLSTPSERVDIAQLLTGEIPDSVSTELPAETSVNIPEINLPDSVVADTAANDEFILFRMDYERMNQIAKDLSLSDQQVLDSLDMGELTSFEADLARQAIRLSRADREALTGYVVKNLPVMMLLLIPVFALILKLLYIRRHYLYIHHIIHGLHLHSFAYLFYGLTLIVSHFLIQSEGWANTINFLSFILVTTYAYFSFLRVYKQGWFKTLVKFNMTGIIYFGLILTFFIGELLISFYLY